MFRRAGFIARRDRPTRFLPWKITEPCFGGGDWMTDRASVDFPDPVSPTMPSVSPVRSSNDTSDTAWSTPPLAPP